LRTVLIDNGYEVRCLDIKNPSLEGDHPISVTDESALTKLVEDYMPAVVFHLAALHFIPYCIEHPVETLETNVEGSLNLFNACLRLNKKPLVIYASSAAVYKPSGASHTETDELGAIDIYGESKIIIEKLSRHFINQTDLPIVGVRFSNVYGPGDNIDHVIPAIMTQIVSGQKKIILGNTTTFRDFVHVSDVVAALFEILKKGKRGDIYNVSTGEGMSINNLILMIINIYEKLTGTKILSASDSGLIRKNDREKLILSNRLMQKDYSWNPKVTIENGITDLLNTAIRSKKHK